MARSFLGIELADAVAANNKSSKADSSGNRVVTTSSNRWRGSGGRDVMLLHSYRIFIYAHLDTFIQEFHRPRIINVADSAIVDGVSHSFRLGTKKEN